MHGRSGPRYLDAEISEASSFSVMAVIGPPIVTFFCVDEGERGWLMLAGIMVAVSLVSVPAARWALASRERYGVTTHSG